MFRKNTASQFIHFQGVDATTGGIKSGVTWTVRRCIDGTFAAATGTTTEDSTNGWYKFAMSQADTNGNNIGFNFTGSGAIPQTVNIITTACDPTTATNFGITALPTTACTTNASLLTSGSSTDQISVSSGKILLQATQSGVTIPTVTTVTNQLTAAAIATGVWTDTTAGDFTTSASIGKSVMNGVALGTGLTINAYTGDTPQTGDSFARIGSTGSGLSSLAPASTALSTVTWTGTLATNLGTLAGHDPGATLGTSTLTQTQVTGGAYSIQSSSCVLGDTRVAHLDADVTSRMATYTQPTGFLTATFPSGTIANTTNITAGTITTASNLTTNNDKTGYGITSNRKKGSGATFEFLMQDSSTGSPKTGLTVAATITKDGGSSASTSNSVTEIGLGQYQIVLTATEMTANNIFLQFIASGAITYSLSLQTQP